MAFSQQDDGPWEVPSQESSLPYIWEEQSSATSAAQELPQQQQQQQQQQLCTAPAVPRANKAALQKPATTMINSPPANGSPYSRALWRPPKARHSVEAINQAYLESQSWVRRPGIGVVYDWKHHHQQNEQLARARRDQERQLLVEQATLKALINQQLSQERYQSWLRHKEAERAIQRSAYRYQAWLNKLPAHTHPPSQELRAKESEWQSSVEARKTRDSLARSRVIHTPGKIAAV